MAPFIKNVGNIYSQSAAYLFDEDIDLVLIFHLKSGGRVCFLDDCAHEEEATLSLVQVDPLAVGLHEFLQARRAFNLEMHGVIALDAAGRGLHSQADLVYFWRLLRLLGFHDLLFI